MIKMLIKGFHRQKLVISALQRGDEHLLLRFTLAGINQTQDNFQYYV